MAVTTGDLCGLCYHSCDPKDKNGDPTHTTRLHADLEAAGMELVAEVESDKWDTYALITRSESAVYVVFRGSSNLKNLQVDLNYQPADEKTMAKYAKEAGFKHVGGLQVHAGFLEAWRSLREEVLDIINGIAEEEAAKHASASSSSSSSSSSSKGLKLVVSGHSMGGAMAMFASLELAARMRKQQWKHPFTNGHVTYTFAAPRLGNAKFARLYNRAFPKSTDHWALQRSNDAVPHLPFAAWGFRHPQGVAYLSMEESEIGEQAIAASPLAPPRKPEKPLARIQRMGDHGDDYTKLRPFGNKMHNWANYHHISAYLEPLQSMLQVDVDVGARPPELEGYEA